MQEWTHRGRTITITDHGQFQTSLEDGLAVFKALEDAKRAIDAEEANKEVDLPVVLDDGTEAVIRRVSRHTGGWLLKAQSDGSAVAGYRRAYMPCNRARALLREVGAAHARLKELSEALAKFEVVLPSARPSDPASIVDAREKLLAYYSQAAKHAAGTEGA